MMKKVISFSLWGDNPNYNVGAIKNSNMALNVYPDFECWFYVHKESVPEKTISKLTNIPNTRIIYKTGDISKIKPMTWRFESIDHPDVEINLSRDTDTRFLTREILAVNEWLEGDKDFHIMRDHPHHSFNILGGMFGTRKIKNIPSWTQLINTYIHQTSERDYDQVFLKNIIYPLIVNNSLVHSSFRIYANEYAKPFPISYCDKFMHVGGYVYADDSISYAHCKLLRDSLQ